MNKKSTNKYWRFFTEKKLDYLILFLILIIYYGQIQWSVFVGDPDGFYHSKIAWFMSQGQLIKDFPWMQFSSLKENFTDHHFLYHLLLVPFTYLSTPLIGVKIATVFFTSISVLFFYWLLKKFQIAWPWLFAFLFISMEGANFRLSLIKANSLSLIMLWLIIYALFKNHRKRLALFGFLFVWIYGGWPIALIALLFFVLAEKIYDLIHQNKIKIFFGRLIDRFGQEKNKHKNIKLLLYLLGGLIAGLIIHPYWPQNLYFYYQQIIQIGLINAQGQFPVGGEWYGTTIMHIISAGPHLFIMTVIIILILAADLKKLSRLSWFSLLMTIAFLILTLKSRRYVEYFMPMELLFVASGLNDLKHSLSLKKIQKLWAESSWYLKSYLYIVFLVFATLIMPPIYQKTLNTKLPERWEMNAFAGAANWLENNTEKGAVVFHSDWDEWPALFYFNHHNYYIIGLDPTFMENYNPVLHELYREITYGNIKYDLAAKIKGNFMARYVFIEKEGHQKMINNLNQDPQAQVVYQDKLTIIYKIN